MSDKGSLGCRDIPHLPLVVVQYHQYPDRLFQHIDLGDLAEIAVRQLHRISLFRHLGIQVSVRIRLIDEAAHQPAADTADLLRIQRQILLLRHLDGDRDEIRKPGMAAERAAAGPHAADDLRLVAGAHLPEFDPHMEDRRKILDQISEIHPAVCREEKDDPAVVETVLRSDDLHLKAPLHHLFPADHQCVVFPRLVRVDLFRVLLRGAPQDPFQRLLQLGLADLVIPEDHRSVLRPLRSIRDDVIAAAVGLPVRRKCIDFSDFTESDADHFCHGFTFLSLCSA